MESIELRQGLRLLGLCPQCSGEDTLVQTYHTDYKDFRRVVCGGCEQDWPNWVELQREEKRRGNNLIPVLVRRQKFAGQEQEYGVELSWPSSRREIPQNQLVTSILNAAMLTKFKRLEVCLATEGGLVGKYKGCYMELRNSYDHLGLGVEQDYIQGRGLTEVLDFYERMLRCLFEDEFAVGKKVYQRGEILRLKPENQDIGTVWGIVCDALVKVNGRSFTRRVTDSITGISANPFSRLHLAGLNNQDISELFVPPPNW